MTVELEKRDRRIDQLENQMFTLSNAVNMCMIVITGKRDTNFPFVQKSGKDPKVELPEGKKLIGSETMYTEGDYTMHVPSEYGKEKVPHVKIENSQGKIIFRETLNLEKFTKKLSECITIDNFKVIIHE